MPALHSHLLNNEPQQLLPLREVESINDRGDAVCEVADSAQAVIVAGKLVPLLRERLTPLGEIALSMVNLATAPVQLRQVDEAGLVEVHQAPPLGGGSVQLAIQPCQFGGEELIVGRRGPQGQGLLASQQDIRAQETVAHLFEDKRFECISADVALRTALGFAASPQGIMITAVVVAVPGAIATTHLVTADAHSAVAALDQAPQEPLPGLGSPRIEVAVVSADPAGSLEEIVG